MLRIGYLSIRQKFMKRAMGRWKEIAWTKAEIETLREVWPRESRRVILERLPKRSWSACAGKASSLKIRRLRPSEPLEKY